mmetsp:Transcript_16875/g.47368  ORF Transcript_16875/g.47368 Transcript_16875/m.47368 type:complete len:360 (+) Transcript_16875:454-1533(+)|eukprot:CAMPEP_0119546102 /NCGR_PEP_ID=MMETSP1352-20130426/657_1 /TAXON_ID=265584 /ORGANISM="Stauroneis constricta, Strain CCMP1120" /LENGTH=359 /DNA_ID=CAMNT_0007590765 /DNA_START=348 /DNA_END=1427 /DNA_ORIENTATION=-
MMFNCKTAIFLSLLGVASAATLRTPHAEEPVLDQSGLMSTFRSWASDFEKKYESRDHMMERFHIWVHNHLRIEEHNEQESTTFQLGHNAFSDLTSDEFAQHFHLGKYSNVNINAKTKLNIDESAFPTTERELQNLKLPDYVNWIQMGAVTNVKDQGACGSCWAFSTTGALEGAKFLRTGELVALSEQNLLDCDHTDLGCNGGLMDDAFKFDEKSGGLCSEEDYPYEAVQHDTCNTDCTDVPGSLVRTFYDVPAGDERALLAAVAMQPISVAIQADQFVFQFYKSGVLTDSTCGEQGGIDHGVLAVGYGTDLDSEEPYFLVKNSWGAQWGEEGYIRLGRKSTNEFGMCAILKMASYPEVE